MDDSEYKRGVADCIKDVKRRLDRAKLYVDNPAMHWHPAYIAALEEDLIFFEAMHERGSYSAKSTLDSIKP